ncbi:glycoside hydrolase [Novosphingobium profundi]|uniref:glycoside hydrolase n=1 Tax=Novosphingobium profundi TaxID=1774954 RepID=UPI0031BB53C5
MALGTIRKLGPLLLCTAMVTPALAQDGVPDERLGGEPAVTITLRPDLAQAAGNRRGAFEGWGTALAWFANVTGGWPDAERNRLADLFYGRADGGEEGLGWTIARYNIGGGNAQDSAPYLRTGAAVPGFWAKPKGATGRDWWNPEDPAQWNWQADANQRWWLDAIRQRVKAPIFEAFSNSPPWFMTVSGRVSGADKATDDNLRPGMEGAFAEYLARVVDELQKRHHIVFRTLSPMNEPNTDYWHATNTQEGSHWSPQRQSTMIEASDAALRRHGLATKVAASDETNSHLFLRDWAGWSPAARAKVGQLNVHSYGTVHQTAVRDIATASGIPLWMSENDTPLPGDPETFTGMASPLAFAEHVVLDLKRLEPTAWVFWQAVETLSGGNGKPSSNWGLVKADMASSARGPHPIHVTGKYWAMAQFSRYIRPGDRLVPVDDMDTAGALSADGERLVMVHVNAGLSPRNLVVPKGWRVSMIVTDASRHAACLAGTRVPARAIATLVLTKGDAKAPCT